MTRASGRLLLAGLFLTAAALPARADDCPQTCQPASPAPKSCFAADCPEACQTCLPATCPADARCCADVPARGKLVTKTYPVASLISPVAPTSGCCKDGTPDQWLLRLISRVVAPHSWSEVGGMGVADYYPIGSTLVVHQTAEVHEQVQELLTALGRARQECCHPVKVVTALPPAPTPVLPPMPAVQALTVQAMPHVPSPGHFVFGRRLPTPAVATEVIRYEVALEPSAPATCPVTCASAPKAVDFVVPCSTLTPGQAMRKCVFHAASQNGQPVLTMESAGDFKASCKQVILNLPNGGTMQFTTNQKQILVNGPDFEAAANNVTLSDGRDRLMLDGDVTVRCRKNGQTASISGGRVTLGIGGQMEIQTTGSITLTGAK
jgi:hypothetical protein